MIAFLEGVIKQHSNTGCILLVGGVGYEVELPLRLLKEVAPLQVREFFIYTHVKEDQLKLFGFASTQEKELFGNLLTISGVGPKAALSILGVTTVSEINQAIMSANVAFFTKIKGLGKKTAQKIIIELKNKVGGETELNLNTDNEPSYSPDVYQALLAFGFARKEIQTTLEAIHSVNQDLTEAALIKLALQQLGKS